MATTLPRSSTAVAPVAPPPMQSERVVDFPARADVVVPALAMAQSPIWTRRLAWFLGVLIVAFPIACLMLPWRQSIAGAGRVIAYAALERRYNVESPISGRIKQWFVAEGDRVEVGQLIAEISDNDPLFVESLSEQKRAIEQKRDAAVAQSELYSEYVARFREVRDVALKAANYQVDAAREKVKAKTQDLNAAQVAYDTEKFQIDRIRRIHPLGLASDRELEVQEQKFREAEAKLGVAKAGLEVEKAELETKIAYRDEIDAKTNADIAKAETDLQTALAKVAEAVKEIQDLDIRLRRQSTQEIRATRAGAIFRILVNDGTVQVKEADPIAVIVPETTDLAVELFIHGNDMPLVHPGAPVRIQFEGWPAIQFIGWPSVAIGSFGGEVSFVDQADSGQGKFRIVIRPNADGSEPWPSNLYLRQGSRARAWVLLREVPLWFEVWRRLNAFPPSLLDDVKPDEKAFGGQSVPDEKGGYEIKRPKLPKI